MPPLKPDMCVVDRKAAVFLGADYKFFTATEFDAFVRRCQSLRAEMKRAEKREKRKARAG